MGTNFQQLAKFIVTLCFLFSINFAEANPENDRIFQLDSVGWLDASDNADGIFTDFLEEQYSAYFSAQTRFVVKPLDGLSTVFNDSNAKYSDLIQQPEIIKKISLRFKIENLIRTQVSKEGDSYHFQLEWVYAPKGDVLSSVEFRYTDPRNEEGLLQSELPKIIHKGLDDLIQKLPFLGQVTGIDGDTITISVGRNQNLKPKDFVTLYTLQSLKRHPILKTIEEWQWQPVGRAQVDQVEDSLCFAKVTQLENGQKIMRFQKIKEILPGPPDPKTDDTLKKTDDIPRLGWVAANIGVGNYSRDVGLPGNVSGRSGGGFLQRFELDSQVWLNSRFNAQGTLAGTIFKYSPTDLASGTSLGTSYSGSGTELRLAVGYALFPMKTVYDSIAWVHLGYKTIHYSLPNQLSDYTANSDFGSLFIGVGGEVALYNSFGAEMGLDLGVLRSASQVDLGFGDASATTDVGFRIAGIYHLSDTFFLRILFKINSQSMDFLSGQSVSQKTFSIVPSFMYYF